MSSEVTQRSVRKEVGAQVDGGGVHRKRGVETSAGRSAGHTLHVDGWMDVRSVGKSDWRGSLGREPGSGQALPSGTHEEESGRLAGGSRGVRGGTGGGHGLSEKPDVLSE